MSTGDAMRRSRAVLAHGGAASVAAACLLLASAGLSSAATPDVTLGLGGYYTKPKGGDGTLPVAAFVTGEAVG
jgi:hypothetical protein